MPLTPKLMPETSLTQDGDTWREKKGTYTVTMAWYVCTCGNRVARGVNNVKMGYIRSCGCRRRRRGGMSDSPTYKTWISMLARCDNEKEKAYAFYGARGISVCDRWYDFANFLEDMGERPPGKTLDRYPDKLGNYEPSNCRWATKPEQDANKTTNVYLTIDGVTKTIGDWAKMPGAAADSTIRARLRHNWPPGEAVFAPLIPPGQKRLVSEK